MRLHRVGSGFVVALLAASLGRGARAREQPPRVASYELSARLDTNAHTVDGSGTLHWVNTSERPTDELYFHLYLNAFANAHTLFQRSPFQRARSGRTGNRPGSIELTRLYARELDRDLLIDLEPHSPGDPADATDRRVGLPKAIAPGEELTLELAWHSVLPDLVERTGVSRDFYLIAQWFPKLARFEKNGVWAHFAFHPFAEFYADFGDYDVQIDVPSRWLVAASGERLNERLSEGRRVQHYRANGVHDFAWTAWPHFERRSTQVGETAVEVLSPPGHLRNAEVTLDTVRFALPYFEARYGDYPYRTLTVVHPPEHASAAGGMEYPTFITTGGPWHVTAWSRALETVTVHELGHQWFYGLLASNEERWPFLDEGLNSYAESDVLEARFGRASAASLFGFELSNEAVHRSLMTLEPLSIPIAAAASEFGSFRQISAVIYARTSLLMRSLANVYGREALSRALAAYAARQRFEHPDPDALLAVMAEQLGPLAHANLRSALFDGGQVNYEVRDLQVRSVAAPPTADANGRAAAQSGPGFFESQVTVYRHGELVFPVDIVLTTSAGERIVEHWAAQERSRVISHVGSSPVTHAVVDAERGVLIEENLLDNAVHSTPRFPARLFERVFYWGQLLLGALEP